MLYVSLSNHLMMKQLGGSSGEFEQPTDVDRLENDLCSCEMFHFRLSNHVTLKQSGMF